METTRNSDNNNSATMSTTPLRVLPIGAMDFKYVQTINEKQLNEFSVPWNFSDVVLVVEGTKFHVHRCILSICSPVFQAMFTSQFKESTAEEIPLPGKRADEVEQLLKLIYFDDTKQQVTETNYEFLLELANEYQIDKVLKFCGQYMKQDINEQNCLRRYKITDCFGLEDVKEKCNEEACFKSSADLEHSTDFHCLGFESKFNLCLARMKELEKALAKYAEICSKMVNKYHEALSEKMSYEMQECDNWSAHSIEFLDFDPSCKFCRKAVERCKGDIDIDALHFDDLFIQLHDLEQDDKVTKIRKNIKHLAIATIARRFPFI